MSLSPCKRKAFSLIELLTVIAILTLILQLMFPAVQMAREAARRADCANNLRQLGLAMMHHHGIHGRFPSGGWSWRWVGEPERGTDRSQPGSWAYNILDFIEQEALRDLGQDLEGSERLNAIEQRCQTPVDMLVCPTRRSPMRYTQAQYGGPNLFRSDGLDGFPLAYAARSDYAVNTGDFGTGDMPFGPRSIGPDTLAEGDDGSFPWPDGSQWTGICFVRSHVGIHHVTDGTSQTYLIGEKNVDPMAYGVAAAVNLVDKGDAENLYTGFNNDNGRSTAEVPMPDTPGQQFSSRFGSAHRSGFQAAFCDGSVHWIRYDIDAAVLRSLGNRQDGAVVGMGDF